MLEPNGLAVSWGGPQRQINLQGEPGERDVRHSGQAAPVQVQVCQHKTNHPVRQDHAGPRGRVPHGLACERSDPLGVLPAARHRQVCVPEGHPLACQQTPGQDRRRAAAAQTAPAPGRVRATPRLCHGGRERGEAGGELRGDETPGNVPAPGYRSEAEALRKQQRVRPIGRVGAEQLLERGIHEGLPRDPWRRRRESDPLGPALGSVQAASGEPNPDMRGDNQEGGLGTRQQNRPVPQHHQDDLHCKRPGPAHQHLRSGSGHGRILPIDPGRTVQGV